MSVLSVLNSLRRTMKLEVVTREDLNRLLEHLELPEYLTDVIKCKNPRCITSVEQEIVHKFRLADREGRKYRCIYCDTEYSEK